MWQLALYGAPGIQTEVLLFDPTTRYFWHGIFNRENVKFDYEKLSFIDAVEYLYLLSDLDRDQAYNRCSDLINFSE